MASFRSGSDLSFGLKIRYDLEKASTQSASARRSYLEAPQERDKIEMQRETYWVVLTLPVLSIMTNCETNYYDHKV